MNAITATGARLVAALVLASSFAASEPKDAQTDRVFIGSSRVDAPACARVSQEFLTRIPDAERLDRRFKGAIDGVESNACQAAAIFRMCTTPWEVKP